MGTWGTGSFDNDSAMDWLMDFAEEPSVMKILSAFNLVVNEAGYADSLDSEEAVVAAEVVALLSGINTPDFPEEYIENVNNAEISISEELIRKALSSIEIIIKQSELKELWEESEDFPDWIDHMNTLRRRLESLVAI